MKRILLSISFLALTCSLAQADERTIDISGNNTSDSYKSYSQSISLPAQDIVNVKMARYCYFSSTISGAGRLNLYAGGERCYLGTERGKAWPSWTRFTGEVHISSNPLLYNSGMQAKPAWRAVRSALRHQTLANRVTSPAMQPAPLSTAVYTLDGRRVTSSTLKPGLYIKDGKKVVIN